MSALQDRTQRARLYCRPSGKPRSRRRAVPGPGDRRAGLGPALLPGLRRVRDGRDRHPRGGHAGRDGDLARLAETRSILDAAHERLSDAIFLEFPARRAKRLLELVELCGRPAEGGTEIAASRTVVHGWTFRSHGCNCLSVEATVQERAACK